MFLSVDSRHRSKTTTSHQKRPPSNDEKMAELRACWKSDDDSDDDVDPVAAIKRRQIAARDRRKAKEPKLLEKSDVEQSPLPLKESALPCDAKVDVAVDESASKNDDNEIILLGESREVIVGFNHPSDHPGALKLSIGCKLSLYADLRNEKDALAIRFTDMNGKSCGFIEKESQIKAALFAIALQQKHQPQHNWLNQIEVEYKGPVRKQGRYKGTVAIRFYGTANHMDRLRGTMSGVKNFCFNNKVSEAF